MGFQGTVRKPRRVKLSCTGRPDVNPRVYRTLILPSGLDC